jgi:hypothetical protein
MVNHKIDNNVTFPFGLNNVPLKGKNLDQGNGIKCDALGELLGETHGNLGNKMRVSSQTWWQPVLLGEYKIFSISIGLVIHPFVIHLFCFFNKKITCNIL